MTAETKNKFKKALLSWMCVAALASGAVPGGFSGIIPTLTVAAEDPVTIDAEIDLAQLVNYQNGTTTIPTGVSVFTNSNGYSLRIDQSGTYKLKGSNYINNSYVDVRIQTKSGVNANIICDDVYIKNDYGDCFSISGGPINDHSYFTPFDAYWGSMTLSGKVTVETYFCQSDNFHAPVTTGNVTGSFFTVTYKDAAGNTLGRTSYLSGGTYEDKSGIPANYACVTSNGAAFDYNNITAAATVICADHSFDANGKCTNCGAKYEIDLSMLADYASAGGSILDGKVSVVANSLNGSPQYTVYISESGSYIIKGSNYINSCYCDVEFYSRNNANVTLVCDDVYIRNDDSIHVVDTSGNISHYDELTPFNVGSGSLKLTGKLAVETYCCYEGDYYESPTWGNVTADLFEVTYKDENNKVIGKSFYLNGGTYSDKSEIPSQYPCVSSNSTAFDYNNITAAATVICANHSFGANGNCINCGRNFTITGIAVKTNPQKTSYYAGETFDPTGLELELTYADSTTDTVTYSESNKNDFTFSVSDNLTAADTKVTVTYKTFTADFPITVTKKSTGGSTRPTTPPEPDKPIIGGTEKSWSDVAKDIDKLTEGETETISLNGNTTIPAEVIKAIADTKAVVTFRINSAFSWTVDGSTLKESDIMDYDFSIKVITPSGTETLRGAVGTGFTIDSVTEKATLNINFKTTHIGKFANLYKKVDGELVFVDNVKIDENGAAVGLEISEKGEYVVMLGELSDRPGDMDNDGILNSKDSLAVVKDFLGIESGVNPLVADVNVDGFINSKDALIIFKKSFGIE